MHDDIGAPRNLPRPVSALYLSGHVPNVPEGAAVGGRKLKRRRIDREHQEALAPREEVETGHVHSQQTAGASLPSPECSARGRPASAASVAAAGRRPCSDPTRGPPRYEHVSAGDWIMRRPEVERTVGLSRSQIYELMSKGLFPRPLRLGPRAVGWRSSFIFRWLDERTEA